MGTEHWEIVILYFGRHGMHACSLILVWWMPREGSGGGCPIL